MSGRVYRCSWRDRSDVWHLETAVTARAMIDIVSAIRIDGVTDVRLRVIDIGAHLSRDCTVSDLRCDAHFEAQRLTAEGR